MEKEEIRIEAPFTVAGVTLVPIVKTSLKSWHSKGRLSFFSTKQPVSVVVVSPQARRAFRTNGEEVPLDQLTGEVLGLKEVLEAI
jgi:hypothetical protein